MSNKVLWWAYLHSNGNILIKKYFNMSDLDNARESNFVKKVIPPFYASSREEAQKIASEKIIVKQLA